jgi:hypothetical protein
MGLENNNQERGKVDLLLIFPLDFNIFNVLFQILVENLLAFPAQLCWLLWEIAMPLATTLW